MNSGVLAKPGKFVVLEGLDEAGKSTVLEWLGNLSWVGSAPLRLHLPSGANPWTKEVYRLLEREESFDPVSKQLLHLACHADTVPLIRKQLIHRAVVLDRWWWSTVAYGTASGIQGDVMTSLARFAQAIWQKLSVDLIVLMVEPHRPVTPLDSDLKSKYEELTERTQIPTISVPRLPRDEVLQLIWDNLCRHGIVADESISG